MTATAEVDRDAMIVGNLGLVREIAKGFEGRGLDRDDLVGEGVIGLIRAVEKFEPARGFRFSTYAVYWIRQSMQRAVAFRSRTVAVPVYLTPKMNEWRRAEKALYLETGRRPGFDEVADRLGIDDDARGRMAKALAASRPTVGGDAVDLEGDGPAADAVDDDDLAGLDAMLSALTDRERDVVAARFGLDGREPMTLAEVGDGLGVSRERVRQIEAKALRRMGSSAPRTMGVGA